MKALLVLHPCQPLVLSVFYILAIPADVKWYLILVFLAFFYCSAKDSFTCVREIFIVSSRYGTELVTWQTEVKTSL